MVHSDADYMVFQEGKRVTLFVRSNTVLQCNTNYIVGKREYGVTYSLLRYSDSGSCLF